MSTQSIPLSAEPSLPTERAEHDLPPKSYATALTEPEEQHTAPAPNGNNGVNFDSSKQNGSAVKTNLRGADDKKVIYEKHINGSGELITSVKPHENYEEALRHNEEAAPRDKVKNKKQDPGSGLSSGRQAAAGWDQSA